MYVYKQLKLHLALHGVTLYFTYAHSDVWLMYEIEVILTAYMAQRLRIEHFILADISCLATKIWSTTNLFGKWNNISHSK